MIIAVIIEISIMMLRIRREDNDKREDDKNNKDKKNIVNDKRVISMSTMMIILI